MLGVRVRTWDYYRLTTEALSKVVLYLEYRNGLFRLYLQHNLSGISRKIVLFDGERRQIERKASRELAVGEQ